MRLSAHGVQSDNKSFMEAVGKEVDLRSKELSQQRIASRSLCTSFLMLVACHRSSTGGLDSTIFVVLSVTSAR